MSGSITVQVTQHNKTPIFVVSHDTYGVDFSQIFGATKMPGDALRWYYPAYYPVHGLVVDDLLATGRQMKVDVDFSEAAEKHIAKLDEYTGHIENARLPSDFEFKTKPYQHQLDGLIHLTYNLRSALFYDCGIGKGLPRTALVLTPTGWCEIGQLRVGDRVIGGDGRAHLVTGVFPQPKQRLNKVTFTDGTSIRCDDAHLWRVQSVNDQARTGHWQVLSTEELRRAPLQYGTSQRRNKYRIPMTPPVVFPTRKVPLAPYLFGVLLGDGAVGEGQTPSFTSEDDAVGERVRGITPYGVQLRRAVYDEKCPVWHLHTNRGKREVNRVTQALKHLGVYGCRAWEKFVPDIYLFNSCPKRLELLQALLDTDAYGDGTPEFSSTSKALADAVVFLVQSLGGTARIRPKKSTYVYKHKRKRGRPAWRVSFSLPPSIIPFSIPRKIAVYRGVTRGLNRRIKSIKPAGRGRTVCITVDSPDQCFLTEHCVVTHNTKIIIDWQRAVGCWPLIVCPRIAVHVWTAELKAHGIDQEYQPVDGVTKKKKLQQIEEAGQYHGMIITYDTLRLHYAHVAEHVGFNAIVADESQKIKQSRSQRTKVALEMSKGAYRRVIMSGTPSLGDPRDVYPQYRFLAPYFMPWNLFHFKRIFCVTSPYNKRIVTGFKNLDILNRRINLVSIRRKKDECLDLPERTFQDLKVSMKPKQYKLYNDLAKTVTESCGADLEAVVNALVNTSAAMGIAKGGDRVINIPHAAALINKLIQVSAGFVIKETVPEEDPCTGCTELKGCVTATPPIKPWTPRCLRREELGPPPEKFAERLDSGKAVALADLLDDLLQAKDNKVIIWGQYIEELCIIEEVVQAKGVGYVRVDGSNTQHAQKFETTFNGDPDCRVYVGQVATGVSITLNSAQYMAYFSLPWNMEHYLQSLDRNHRLGQGKNVTVYRLMCKGVDRHIARALAVKKVVADALIDEEASCRKVSRPITKVHEI